MKCKILYKNIFKIIFIIIILRPDSNNLRGTPNILTKGGVQILADS